MILLEVNVLTLGRFFVHDDYSVEEVLLLPATTDKEMAALTAELQSKETDWSTPEETLRACLATLYSLTEKDDVVILFAAPVELQWEPEDI